jgi:hypothetical protein
VIDIKVGQPWQVRQGTPEVQMSPSKFIAHHQRRYGRPFTIVELEAVAAARGGCRTGKRDQVQAMWAALKAIEHRNVAAHD